MVHANTGKTDTMLRYASVSFRWAWFFAFTSSSKHAKATPGNL